MRMVILIMKNWRKLDNTAKIFTLDAKKNTNIFRLSAILKDKVDPNVLELALTKTLSEYRAFKVKIKWGFFWNYLEYNKKEPIIKKEEGTPCRYIDFKKNNDYLFRVSYFKKKINLDIFHVLTDGVGASKFLKVLVSNYLDLKYNLGIKKEQSIKEIHYKDDYVINWDRKVKVPKERNNSYELEGKIHREKNNTYHYTVSVLEIKNICKKYKVTITEYLTALYMYALYLSCYKKKTKKELTMTVPVDLRKHYNSDTLSNFFVSVCINPKIREKKLTTFEEILKEVHSEFKKQMTNDKLKSRLAKEMSWGMNVPIRLIPLFIKKPFMANAGFIFSKSTTSTLSNIGIINFEDKYKRYIDNILVLVMPGKLQKIKCTICSYDNKLNITMNSLIDDTKFEKTFHKLLSEKISNVSLEHNC